MDASALRLVVHKAGHHQVKKRERSEHNVIAKPDEPKILTDAVYLLHPLRHLCRSREGDGVAQFRRLVTVNDARQLNVLTRRTSPTTARSGATRRTQCSLHTSGSISCFLRRRAPIAALCALCSRCGLGAPTSTTGPFPISRVSALHALMRAWSPCTYITSSWQYYYGVWNFSRCKTLSFTLSRPPQFYHIDMNASFRVFELCRNLLTRVLQNLANNLPR